MFLRLPEVVALRFVGNDLGSPPDIPSERRQIGSAGTEAAVDQRALVERAGRGDHDAFAVLVRASAPRLDAAARLILRDRELAGDAVQEAYIRAWRNLPGLRDPDRFDGWLHRLLVRSCIDALRHRRSRPLEVELHPFDGPSIGDPTSDVVERELIDDALRRLDPTWRAVVVLHYFLGMSLPETANTLGIPLGTAKSRLHRSLGLMRLAITDEVAQPALSKGQTA
jgi:RNA polymerase sigma-70 factor (ECF subfamily)